EAYLGGAGEEDRPALLRELLALDLAYRRRAGEAPRAEEYLRRFPAHADLIHRPSPRLALEHPRRTYRPRIEDYRARVEEPRAELLAELVRTELEWRCRRGGAPRPAEYTVRFWCSSGVRL